MRKPLVLNPWNLDALLEFEKEFNRRVFVAKLRKEKISNNFDIAHPFVNRKNTESSIIKHKEGIIIAKLDFFNKRNLS